MTYCAVISTVSNQEDAKKIAHGLVSNKLAACTNIISNVTSVYYWEDQVCEDTELILFIKTQKVLFEEVKNFILQNHPYTVPEIIMLPIENGYNDYLNWINQSTL